MNKFFHVIGVLLCLVAGFPVEAKEAAKCPDCIRYKRAKHRSLKPTDAVLACIHFTLPSQGGKVMIKVWREDQLIIEDAKEVTQQEDAFCYPKDRWGVAPDKSYKVRLCAQHSVVLTDDQIEPVMTKGRVSPKEYACLRGIAGCGGQDKVSIPANKL